MTILLLALPGTFVVRMLLSSNPTAQANTVRENLADQVALEQLPAIFPALLATYEPHRFLVYAPGAKQVSVRLLAQSPELTAVDLGHGVHLLDVDPRKDPAFAQQQGTEAQCRITADGKAVERTLSLVQPQPHPRLLRSDPSAGITATVSGETDELILVQRDGRHQRVAIGDGPTDCALFDDGRKVIVAHRHTPELIAKELNTPAAEQPENALAGLRKTIRDLSDELNGNLHRDQFEVLLLATKVLTDEVPDTDRYHLTEDAELLLYFCRMILPKSSDASDQRYKKQDSSAYLRSYFDTVMRTKLRMKPQHVEDLLEIQWEATNGEFYIKPKQTTPILAVYLFPDQCLLLLDIPGGVSRFYSLEGQDCVADIQRACAKAEYRLPLPNELQRELVQLRNRGIKFGNGAALRPEVDRETARLQLRWIDPQRGITLPETAVALRKPVTERETELGKTSQFDFPFLIPEGLATDSRSAEDLLSTK